MRRYLYISLGGFIGALLRYAIGALDTGSYFFQFPAKTFFINVTGSFLLGLFLITADIWIVDDDIKTGVSVGFLGAYTTFSTFCSESVSLIDKGLYIPALYYLLLSPIVGLAAVWLGVSVARRIAARLRGKDAECIDELIKEVD